MTFTTVISPINLSQSTSSKHLAIINKNDQQGLPILAVAEVEVLE